MTSNANNNGNAKVSQLSSEKRKTHAPSLSSLSCDKNEFEDAGVIKSRGTGITEEEIRNLLLREAAYDIDDTENQKITKKRCDYITWDDYFMAISILSAQRSKDPQVQNGACIVDENNRIVGIGYNGFPQGCPDDCLPWASSSSVGADGIPPLHTKYLYVCHAEINAVLNRSCPDLAGKRMYVPDFPGNECAKVIIQAGITEVVYTRSDSDSDSIRASTIMFQMAGVKMTHYTPSRPNPVAPLIFSSSDDTTTTTSSQQQNGGNHHPPVKEEINNEKENADLLSIKSSYHDLLLNEANYDTYDAANTQKRNNYLSWDDYFIAVAFLSARRSKDPSTQVGACIVDANRCIVGIGYNGFPRGCSDDHLPWSRDSELPMLHKKYPYVVHAEVNAIMNSGSKDVRGATLYVDLFPCNECAKVIIQSGMREVVYLNDKYHDSDECRASRIMFQMAGVKYRQHLPSHKVINLKF